MDSVVIGSRLGDRLATYAMLQHKFNRARKLTEAKVSVSHCSRPVPVELGSRLYCRKSTYRVKNTYEEAVPRETELIKSDNILTTNDIVSIIKDEFKVLEHEKYDPTSSPRLALTLCDEIKLRVKDGLSDRYRVIVNVFIAGNSKQELNVVSKALMASATDTFESYSFSNTYLHAVGIVFLVYLE